MPSHVLSYSTPHQVFFQSFPRLRAQSPDLIPKVFWHSAFVDIPSHPRSKLDPRAHKCIFLRYAPTQRGYKCFSPFPNRVYVTMDVIFFEDVPFYSKNDCQGENVHNNQLQSCASLLEIEPELESITSLYPIHSHPSTSSSIPTSPNIVVPTNANKNLHTYTRNKQVERTGSRTNHISQTSEPAPTSKG